MEKQNSFDFENETMHARLILRMLGSLQDESLNYFRDLSLLEKLTVNREFREEVIEHADKQSSKLEKNENTESYIIFINEEIDEKLYMYGFLELDPITLKDKDYLVGKANILFDDFDEFNNPIPNHFGQFDITTYANEPLEKYLNEIKQNFEEYLIIK